MRICEQCKKHLPQVFSRKDTFCSDQCKATYYSKPENQPPSMDKLRVKPLVHAMNQIMGAQLHRHKQRQREHQRHKSEQ